MFKSISTVLLLSLALSLQVHAEDYVLVSSIGGTARSSSPAGTEVTFSCVTLPEAETPFLYEWTVINNEDSSVEYSGFDDPEITMTPIDKRSITVYCSVYGMMLEYLGETPPLYYTWKPAVALRHFTLPTDVTYTGNITLPLFFADDISELTPGRVRLTRQDTSKWLHDSSWYSEGSPTTFTGGYYNIVMPSSGLPGWIIAKINNTYDPPGEYVDSIRFDFIIEAWDCFDETWDYQGIASVVLRVIRGSTPGTYTLED